MTQQTDNATKNIMITVIKHHNAAEALLARLPSSNPAEHAEHAEYMRKIMRRLKARQFARMKDPYAQDSVHGEGANI